MNRLALSGDHVRRVNGPDLVRTKSGKVSASQTKKRDDEEGKQKRCVFVCFLFEVETCQMFCPQQSSFNRLFSKSWGLPG